MTGRWLRPPLTAIATETVVFVAAAAVVGRPRPDVPRLDRPAPTSSFPSGHTGATTAMHLAFAADLARRGGPAWLSRLVRVGVPAAVGFSRLYRGMHHPSDVVVGTAVGVIVDRVVRPRALRTRPAP